MHYFGIDATMHHVGIAVQSIDAVMPGLTKIADPIQKVTVAFFRLGGATMELVEPLGETSPVTQFIRKGQTFYHLCFEVGNVVAVAEHAMPYGFRAIAKPAPAVAFGGRHILWTFHRRLGLFELLERAV
jgi:methylmalonyl-CoA/ethylmalonyl-CoA epimerase